jgi:16S rRNA (adenine1518-N6/adenine1519-N6)-dimethyltransferase
MNKDSLFQDPDLDQVFMTDENILKKIVEFSDLKKSDVVLEIGTGPGNLTEALAGKCRKVMTIEIDERLKPELEKRFFKKNIEIVWGNALDVIENGNFHYDKIVANPPYSISEALIKSLFRRKFESAVLTLPWRFVERLTANAEEDHYSRLSLFAQSFFRIESLLRVGKDAWRPRPDTMSMIIRITHKKPEARDVLLREMALQDDKKLKNALREAFTRIRGKTKRSARDELDDTGLRGKLLEKKISEMSMDDVNEVLRVVLDYLSQSAISC